MNNVTIEYLLKNHTEFRILNIEYKDYFDLDEDEEVDTDCVPEYLQPFEYLDVDLNELVFLKVNFEINNNMRTVKQTFWNNGENVVTENIETGDRNFRELIISVKLNEKMEFYEILRLDMDNDFILPKYHGLFRSGNEVDEIEEKFDIDLFRKFSKHIKK